MIDPATNKDGETVEAYCRRRWGGSGWTRSMISSGKKDGATFSNWEWYVSRRLLVLRVVISASAVCAVCFSAAACSALFLVVVQHVDLIVLYLMLAFMDQHLVTILINQVAKHIKGTSISTLLFYKNTSSRGW